MSKPKMAASGLLVAVFAMGIVVGNTGRLLADRSESKEDTKERKSYIEWLEEDMTLNTQQETSITVILEQYNNDMHELWSEVRPKSAELRRSARAAIAEIMSDEQQVIYEQKNQKLDSLRAERRNRDDEE